MQNLKRKVAVFGLALTAGCTLITEAGERQVDPDSEKTLDFAFKSMDAHGSRPAQTLDVALTRIPLDAERKPVVGAKPVVVARARIVLPPAMPPAPYPDEWLKLRGVLDENPHRLFFYVDDDDNNVIRLQNADNPGGEEHIWIRDVPPTREFTHTLQFDFFDETAYAQSRNLTLNVDLAALAPWQAVCAAGVEQTLIVRIVLNPQTEDPVEIGYYKNYASNPLPMKPILLKGIADVGSTYEVQTYVNGRLLKRTQLMAPPGEFVVPFKDWYPLALPDALLEQPRCPK